jgi:hypothetical protein
MTKDDKSQPNRESQTKGYRPVENRESLPPTVICASLEARDDEKPVLIHPHTTTDMSGPVLVLTERCR